MMRSLDRLIADWAGVMTVVRYFKGIDAWLFLAVHDVTLGPAVGGTRIQRYDSSEEALLDAMRLAEAMTRKWAIISAPCGGGKAVIAPQRPLSGSERHRLLEEYACVLNALGGAFRTGEDVGVSRKDALHLSNHTPWISGLFEVPGLDEPSAYYTARGVLAGLRVALRHEFGTDDLHGRTILVQGVGKVGAWLACLAAERGARLLVSDLDRKRAEKVADGLRGQVSVVNPRHVYGAECDVFAPCALGRVLNQVTVARLRCRVVAGAANDQLATEEDAVTLHGRGILYVPDFAINTGAIVGLDELGPTVTPTDRERAVDEIGDLVDSILHESRARAELPTTIARERAERALRHERTT